MQTLTLDEAIKEYELQAKQKERLLKQIEKDQPEKRTLTVKRLTESKERLEAILGFLMELKGYRENGN